MKNLQIDNEPVILIPASGWIELAEVLRILVQHPDVGSNARDAYCNCMRIVADSNPELIDR